MRDNGKTFISTSVVKQAFNEDCCEITPLVLHFIQKTMREKNSNYYSDIKINIRKSGTDEFHRKCYSIIKDEYKSNLSWQVVLYLFKLKGNSNKNLIEPTIISENLGIIGEPDIVSFSNGYANILELKNRSSGSFSFLDRIQAETYMLVFKDGSSKILERRNPHPAEIKRRYKENVRSSILYNDGNIVPIMPENGNLITLKASEILNDLDRYKSIEALPKPEKCSRVCVNFKRCTRKTDVIYENFPTSPGRTEIKSVAYGARA